MNHFQQLKVNFCQINEKYASLAHASVKFRAECSKCPRLCQLKREEEFRQNMCAPRLVLPEQSFLLCMDLIGRLVQSYCQQYFVSILCHHRVGLLCCRIQAFRLCQSKHRISHKTKNIQTNCLVCSSTVTEMQFIILPIRNRTKKQALTNTETGLLPMSDDVMLVACQETSHDFLCLSKRKQILGRVAVQERPPFTLEENELCFLTVSDFSAEFFFYFRSKQNKSGSFRRKITEGCRSMKHWAALSSACVT